MNKLGPKPPNTEVRKVTARKQGGIKRAFKFRSGGEWLDDDYDVFDGNQHIWRSLMKF